MKSINEQLRLPKNQRYGEFQKNLYDEQWSVNTYNSEPDSYEVYGLATGMVQANINVPIIQLDQNIASGLTQPNLNLNPQLAQPNLTLNTTPNLQLGSNVIKLGELDKIKKAIDEGKLKLPDEPKPDEPKPNEPTLDTNMYLIGFGVLVIAGLVYWKFLKK